MKQSIDSSFYKDCISVGLRRDYRKDSNVVGLEQCINLEIIEGSLHPPERIENVSVISTIEYPYTKIYNSRSNVYLLEKDAIYVLDTSGKTVDKWSAEQQTLYNTFDVSNTNSILNEGIWHVADFGQGIAFFNGLDTVLKTGSSITSNDNKFYVTSDLTITTGCSYRGRSFLGGFNADNFNYSGATDIFNNFIPNWTSTGFRLTHNHVMWSTIGGGLGDLYWLMFPETMTSGHISDGIHDSDHPMIIQSLMRNEWGFMSMPFSGKVVRLEPGKDFVGVYGENGVCLLYTTPASGTVPSIVGLEDIINIGIAGRGAVANSPKGQLFIDSFGNMRLLTRGGLETIGYREYFIREDLSNCIIIYIAGHDKFIINFPDRSYTLTQNGLSETPIKVHDIINVNGRMYGISHKHSSGFDVLTNSTKFGFPGVKVIESIEFDINRGTTPIYAYLMYRQDNMSSYHRSDNYHISDNGTAQIGLAAEEFKIGITGVSYADIYSIRNAIIRFKYIDKRNIRGKNDSSSF